MDSKLIEDVEQYLATERRKQQIRPFLLFVVAGMFLIPMIAFLVEESNHANTSRTQ